MINLHLMLTVCKSTLVNPLDLVLHLCIYKEKTNVSINSIVDLTCIFIMS